MTIKEVAAYTHNIMNEGQQFDNALRLIETAHPPFLLIVCSLLLPSTKLQYEGRNLFCIYFFSGAISFNHLSIKN